MLGRVQQGLANLDENIPEERYLKFWEVIKGRTLACDERPNGPRKSWLDVSGKLFEGVFLCGLFPAVHWDCSSGD